jgi:hypothetical protein
MKRFFPTSLALLLVMGSLGHVFAAALCPGSFGRECCFAKTSNHTHDSSSCHQDMAMHLMPMDGMPTDNMAMDDTATVDTSKRLAPPVVNKEAVANRFEQPVEPCPHCLAHSGSVNAPVSFVSVQSGREIGSVLLPVSRFHIRPAIAVAQIGLPREHPPPDSSAPRHILISVFLI